MELTEEQKAFLDAEGKIVLCAVPGSGKTFIVVKKILKYLKKWPLAHQGVAALSFTNVASDEIMRQASELSSEFASVNYPHYVGTLDSFINNFILLRFGYLMQKENQVRPVIIHENYGELNFFSRDGRCHQKMCTQHPEWFHWSSNGLLKDNKPINCDVNPKPCVAYKKALIKRGIVTQREAPALSLMLLKKYPQIASELAYRFPIIIVDEAQDTSREQIGILDCLANAGVQTIILVGDPDQALNEWRDSTPEYFIEKMHEASWNCMYLTTNFRSSQLICNAVKPFSSMLTGKEPATALGENAEFQTKPVLFCVSKGKQRQDVIDAFISLCNENGIEISSKYVSVLTRGRIHSDIVSDIWKTPETKSLAIATYLWHCSNRREAYRLCEKVLYNIEIGNVESLSQLEIRQKAEIIMPFASWNSSIIALLKCLPSPTLSINDWKKHLIEEITKLMQLGVITSYNGRQTSEIVKTKQRDKKHPQFLNSAVIDYFEKRSALDITTSSVHGVKGETFDATLLIVDSTKGANALTPTVLNTGVLNSELIRIAYVAMTRPRKLLAVSIPKTNKQLVRFPKNLWDYRDV